METKERAPFTTHQQRVANLKRHLNNGTLIRREFGDGYKRACLLSALAPEVVDEANLRGVDPSQTYCPAEVMPQWFAHMTPDIDDRVVDESWDELMREYARLAARWTVLDEGDWQWLEMSFRIRMLRALLAVQADDKHFVEDAIAALTELREKGKPVSRMVLKDHKDLEYEQADTRWKFRDDDASHCFWGLVCDPHQERAAMALSNLAFLFRQTSAHMANIREQDDPMTKCVRSFFKIMEKRIEEAEGRHV
jgi:hypothetical protein